MNEAHRNDFQQLLFLTESIGNQVRSSLESVGTADPLEPYLGPNGEIWEPIASGTAGMPLTEVSTPYTDLQGLDQIRRVCRYFARENPFAINGHENRISYIVGCGHRYTVMDACRDSADSDTKQKVQNYLNDFLQKNDWHTRQQENVLRRDRDGETLLRFFEHDDEDILRIRYVEPSVVRTPDTHSGQPHCSFGIETDAQDHETVLNYFVGDEVVPAEEIQHRRRGTLDSKRGTPILWSVRHNLTRALRILRNGSTITEIQTTIGMIRKFLKASTATVQAWAVTQHQKATDTTEEPDENATLLQRFRPGSILNSSGNLEYEFPGMNIDPSRYIESLQAEVRAVASRLVMTEAMFSAKTDDTSRAAAEVSEGPVKRNFERLQHDEITHDREVIRRALAFGRRVGHLSDADLQNTRVEISPPSLEVRNLKEAAETQEIKLRSGVLSIQSARAESGYDDQTEQTNINAHIERTGGAM